MSGNVLQEALPEDMWPEKALPGIAPVHGSFLDPDEAYGGQMRLRRALIADAADTVHALLPQARAASEELLEHVLQELPAMGYDVLQGAVVCPDGVRVDLDRVEPLKTLGRLCQQDFCVLTAGGSGEHVLTGGILCFPASWRLDEKIGRPLTVIHDPVAEYDAHMARRVQRLFDGVRVDRPLWRSNRLWYDDPALFQPRSRSEPQRFRPGETAAAYYRSERQTLFRLPLTQAVIFVIHTYVLARDQVPVALFSGK